MKFKELADKDIPELQTDLVNRRKHLFALRSQAVTEKLEDPTQLRKTRKDIARILTAIRQRELNKTNSQASATIAPATPPAN